MKDHGAFPHLGIEVANGWCDQYDDDGDLEELFEDEVEGDLNPGFEVIDIDNVDDDWLFKEEVTAQPPYDFEDGEFAMDYTLFEEEDPFAHFFNTALTDEQGVIAATIQNERAIQPVGGHRSVWLETSLAEGKFFRKYRTVRGHGTQPGWQKFAGGGKRGRKSIRFATPEPSDDFHMMDHYDPRETEAWHQDWQEEQAALAQIEALLSEFLSFGDQNLKQAA